MSTSLYTIFWQVKYNNYIIRRQISKYRAKYGYLAAILDLQLALLTAFSHDQQVESESRYHKLYTEIKKMNASTVWKSKRNNIR